MRTSRLLVLQLVVLAVGLAAPARASAAVAPDWAGVNAYHLFATLPAASWDAHLDAMRDAGVRLVRYDASWARVEPAAPDGGVHDYRFAHHDRVVAALARRGIRWYPVVDYSAPWAAATLGAWRSPPASADAFAGYAAALARRYGPGGSFWSEHPELPAHPVREWEVWNEENGAYYWPPAPDPAAYADLYAAAHAAIHAVDAGARVVVGGLIARSAGAFVRAMLLHRPGLELDAVGLHAYAVHARGAVQWMESVGGWLRYLGRPGVPVEVTEVGWTTAGPLNLATDEQRAAWLRELLPAAAAVPGVTRLIVHTWATAELRADDGEDWYGLWHPDATPSASGLAFAEALRGLAPPVPETGVVVPASPAVEGGAVPAAPPALPLVPGLGPGAPAPASALAPPRPAAPRCLPARRNPRAFPAPKSVYAPTSPAIRQLPALHAFAAAPDTHRKRVRGKTKCSTSTRRSRSRPHRRQRHQRTAARGARHDTGRRRMPCRGGGARTAASGSRSRRRSRTTRATSTRSRGGRAPSARRC